MEQRLPAGHPIKTHQVQELALMALMTETTPYTAKTVTIRSMVASAMTD